jgi:hypothetical protein
MPRHLCCPLQPSANRRGNQPDPGPSQPRPTHLRLELQAARVAALAVEQHRLLSAVLPALGQVAVRLRACVGGWRVWSVRGPRPSQEGLPSTRWHEPSLPSPACPAQSGPAQKAHKIATEATMVVGGGGGSLGSTAAAAACIRAHCRFNTEHVAGVTAVRPSMRETSNRLWDPFLSTLTCIRRLHDATSSASPAPLAPKPPNHCLLQPSLCPLSIPF